MSRYDNQLRKDLAFLNLILDSSFGNIFVTDGRGNILYANEPVAQDLGLPKEVLVTKSVYDLVDERIISYKPASITVIETGQKYMQSVELPNGTNLVLSAEPLFDEAGNIRYIIVFSQNRTIINRFMQVLQQENQVIRQALSHVQESMQDGGTLVAEAPATKACLSAAYKAAQLDSTIMLYGESGSGKEVFAQLIHRNSRRSQKLFLPVNCAAIPHELMESEFFGYDKGAFTGSSREGKLGLFELADEGTLFLDEIGELDLSMQSKLLRVLEAGEVKRVGGTRIRKVNVRIVGATNRDLASMVNKGSFREDLFYRINVIPITIPALRERKQDTAVLANCFLERLNKKYSANKQFTQSALEVFQKYPWPGNVRELRNVVERIFAVVPEDIITGRQIEKVLGTDSQQRAPQAREGEEMGAAMPEGTLYEATERFQREYILQMLRSCGGSVQRAARQMGIGRSGLYKKMEKLGLKGS